MNRLHRALTHRSKVYSWWHDEPGHKFIHWAVFILVAVLFTLTIVVTLKHRSLPYMASQADELLYKTVVLKEGVPNTISSGYTFLLSYNTSTDNCNPKIANKLKPCTIVRAPSVASLSVTLPSGGQKVFTPLRTGDHLQAGSLIIDVNHLTIQPVTATLRVANTSSVNPPTASPSQPVVLNQIKSVTYWDPDKRLGCSDSLKQDLAGQLPAMKDVGINTVWLVSFWECFSSQTFPTRVYNEQAFSRLKDILQLLHNNGMKAVLPLNYVANIPGTTVDFCSILRYSTQADQYAGYHALRDYVQKYLDEIQSYNNDVVIMLFTEGMICNNYENPPVTVAPLLRSTLGRLPLDLTPALRNKFVIGFHDFVFRWSEPGPLTAAYSPTPLPNPYNFYSFAYYVDNESTASQINSSMDLSISRLRNLYGQNFPVFQGELGANYCAFGATRQAALTSQLVSYAMGKGNGFNVWQWKGFSCSSSGADGFYLNAPNGTPLPARATLKNLLNP